MVSAEVDETPYATKPCRVCAEPIRATASKCIKCGSYQARFGFLLGLSSTVLSLLVALISVSTVCLPIIINTLTAKNSDFVFSIQAVSPREVTLMISNKGTRPGTIRGGMVSVFGSDGNPISGQSIHLVGLDLHLDETSNNSAYLVEPAKSVLLEFRATSGIDKLPALKGDLSGTLYISYTDFQGAQDNSPNQKLDSLDLKRFLEIDVKQAGN